jgi:hypothetical protein
MPWPLAKHRKMVLNEQFAGPTSRGGASLNVFTYADGAMETVEYDWYGRPIERYEGAPREVPPGVTMPPTPERPRGAAPPSRLSPSPPPAPAPPPYEPPQPQPADLAPIRAPRRG